MCSPVTRRHSHCLADNETEVLSTSLLLPVLPTCCAWALAADVQVQQSFTLMNASLNAFLAAVPVKYQRYRV